MKWAHVTFECSYCGTAFSDAEGLKAHAPLHVGWLDKGEQQAQLQPAVTFACSRCGSGFAGSDELRSHAVGHADALAGKRRFHAAVLSRHAAVLSRHALHPQPLGEWHAAQPARRGRAITRGVALVAAALLLVLLGVATASAWWTASATLPATISTGTWASQCPYALQTGTSKARHWDLKDSQPARVLPIAQYDSAGAMLLDFGDEEPRDSNASPDVFRLVSLVAEPRAVSFSVSGAMAAFVTDVRLKGGASVLQGGARESVYVKIGVPADSLPGDYSGTLTVHVDGWTPDAQLPMTITVRGASPVTPAVTPAATPTAEPTSTATATPSPSPSPSSAPAPAPTEAPFVSFTPGLSTVLPLPGVEAPAPAVASLQPDGNISLAFGQVERSAQLCYNDVVRLVSSDSTDASVSFSLSASLANVAQVGFWDAQQAAFSADLTLPAAATRQLAFAFSLPGDAPLGEQQGTLTVVVQRASGAEQQTVLPVSFTVAAAEAASPTPDSSPTPSPTPPPSPVAEAIAAVVSFFGGLARAVASLV